MPPIVPRYDRQVDAAPVPGVRVAPDVQTGNVQAPFQASRELADTASRMAQQEKKRADDAWTQQTYAALVRNKLDLLHGDNGALKRQGRDALAGVGEYQDQFEKFADDLEGSAANETQVQMFRQMREREGLEFAGTLKRHAAQETQRIEEDAFKALTESLSDDAITNPAKAQANLAMLRAAANDYADKRGWHGEDGAVLRQGLVDGIDSRVHGGIILAKLRADDDLGAKAYFDANKDAIKDARMRGQVEAALEEGGLRGEGQRRVDWLLQRFQDLGPAREWIRENLSGKLRDEVDRRARDEYGMRAAQARQNQDAAFVAGYNYLEQNGKLPSAGSPEWLDMTPYQREHLQAYAAKRGEIKGDDEQVLVRFTAMRPEKLAAMTEAQILEQARPKLTDASWHKVLGMWQDAREAMAGGRGSKKELDVKSIYSDKELVLNALKSSKVIDERMELSGLDRDRNSAAIFREFSERVDDEFQRIQREGKKLGDDEKKAIIGSMLTRKVFVDGWGPGDKEKPVALLKQDERKKAYVPIGAIPQPKLTMLLNQARAAGIVAPDVSDERAKVLMKDRLQRAYGAALTGADDNEINLILGGQ